MPIQIDFRFISKFEGGSQLKGYVPDPKLSKSGVTIATGFDLGARNVSDLEKLGFTKELIAKLTPYLGLQSMEAFDYVKKHPLTLIQTEADSIDKAVKSQSIAGIAAAYNKASDMAFEDIPANWQTVIASVSFQYGSLARRCPLFWSMVTKQEWTRAINELRNFGDRYRTRRNAEADLVDPR